MLVWTMTMMYQGPSYHIVKFSIMNGPIEGQYWYDCNVIDVLLLHILALIAIVPYS